MTGAMRKIGKTYMLLWGGILVSAFLISCRRHREHLSVEIHTSEMVESNGSAVVSKTIEEPLEKESLVDYNRELLLPVQVIKRSEVVLQRKSYICSYNKETRCANWSAWYLPKEHADGPYSRKRLKIPGKYIEDDSSIEGRQLLSDWDGVFNYDHGHLCPSGDNKWDLEAMRQTFYLSNMCVQNSSLNQGPWERLESTCREWAKKFNAIYIISGPIFITKPIKTIGTGLSIPDQFFKVVLCADSSVPKAIGFIYDNSDPLEGDRIEKHALSVKEIEKITGYDFFSALPDEIEHAIESEYSLNDWKIYK